MNMARRRGKSLKAGLRLFEENETKIM